jgi:glycosyltransferase involved in cell wall biosynthesis
MKVLFIANAFDRPERALVNGLCTKSVHGYLLSEKTLAQQDLNDSLYDQQKGIALKSRCDLGSILTIRKVIRDFKPDIIHSFSGRALSNALIASIGLKCLHIAYRGTMGNLSFWDPASRMSFLNQRLNKIICVSDAVKDSLLALGVANEKLVRIYKGHDQNWYPASKLSRSDLGLPVDHCIVACVANNRPVKGLDTLINAFLALPKDRKSILLIIGEDPDGSLKKLAAGDSRIIFLGFRSDATQIVSLADVFCMPSRRREGFPKAVIEAMIQGIPAVVTSVGGLPEMVIDGAQGFVVEPDKPKLLSQSLLQLIDNQELRKQLGQQARLRVLNEFSIENTILQTLEVYQQLLKDYTIK